jgi:nicotinamidase-related amidase
MRESSAAAREIVIAFIDLQDGIVGIGSTNDPQRLRVSVAALADLASIFALPVVVSSVPTTGGTVAPLLREITERLPDIQPLVRATPNPMDDAAFRSALEGSGRTTAVIAGVATEVAVRSAALAAERDGLHAIVAVDACNGLDARTEAATFSYLSARGIELSTVAALAAQLCEDFDSERGRLAMRALQSTLVPRTHAHDLDANA